MLKLGLCEGRHDIKGVTDYIFPADFFNTSEDMFDFRRMRKQIRKVFEGINIYEEIDIYVTGYTPAVIEVMQYCVEHNFPCVYFLHYDKTTERYIEQELFRYYDN